MKTDRFKSDSTSCVVAGSTRSLTKKNVIIRGRQSMIQCCPFPEVDSQLDYICKMANQWISSWSRNPFATASWIHLVFVRCHPFEDGNGRLGRLLASIPLMRHGYLPISIKGEQHAAYYDAINYAYNENHQPFIDCMLKGMQDTLVEVKTL
ncbi:fido domain-containing protein [Phlebopus sp. FC_14]|nr:fido domain-containing protein [Phlebopus sp. FC_14]